MSADIIEFPGTPLSWENICFLRELQAYYQGCSALSPPALMWICSLAYEVNHLPALLFRKLNALDEDWVGRWQSYFEANREEIIERFLEQGCG